MILQDIYNFLAADAVLKNLLSASGKDSKIYPNIAKIMSAPPFLVYRSSNHGGTQNEILSEEILDVIITAQNFETVCLISARLTELLDGVTDIPSDIFYIYHSKKTGGADYADELYRNVRVLNFNLKFRSKKDIL
ncbi:MAG: hypothetical protein LBI01_03155 [Elusimicrobium sp.]|jgi:hypothetical protein|nr:hypothetical protein [Elusimicrobium sp.]